MAVAHDLHFIFLPAEDGLLHQHFVHRRRGQSPRHDLFELSGVVGDATAGAGQGERRADDGRDTNLGQGGARFLQ
ncbi:MAG: hypothetical protein FD153_1229 [Rhodospirillaceae bacterium]|nr:MAG: hypothetical protein FD153_1229 [Rhodospirillaceae bacterium]